jgi:transcriptional regulator with XRE-family HTH domain
MPEVLQSPRLSDCGRCAVKTLKVGGKVDLARRAQGLTVGQFAAKCGVPEKTMERICQRQNDPSAKTLFLIVIRGKVSMDVFDEEDFGEEGLI